jgi:hypothetical protein
MKGSMEIVEVDWIDSCSVRGWQRSDFRHEDTLPLPIKTVGYLLRSDKTCVTVIQSVSAEGAKAESLTIPRSCVKKVRELRSRG